MGKYPGRGCIGSNTIGLLFCPENITLNYYRRPPTPTICKTRPSVGSRGLFDDMERRSPLCAVTLMSNKFKQSTQMTTIQTKIPTSSVPALSYVPEATYTLMENHHSPVAAAFLGVLRENIQKCRNFGQKFWSFRILYVALQCYTTKLMLDRRASVSPTSMMKGFFNALTLHICATSYGCHIRKLFFARRQDAWFCSNGYDSRFSVYNATKSSNMQTSIELTGRRPGSAQTIRKIGEAARSVSHQVINRIGSLSERALLRVSMTATAVLIIFAGRYSATSATPDAVMVAVSSLTALLALAISSERSESNQFPRKGGAR